MAIVNSGDWSFEVNLNPTTTTSEMLVAIVAVLVDAGWSIINSSDGTTVGTSTLDATDWANTDAWTHLRDPSGTGGRDLTIQRGSTQTLRILQSLRGDPMIGGTPTATPVPTSGAANRLSVFDGAAFAYATFFNFTVGSNQIHIGAGSLPVGESGDVYPFYISNRFKGSGTIQAFCCVLPVSTPADGTVGDADVEPLVAWQNATFTSQGNGWYLAGLGGQAVRRAVFTATLEAALQGQNPYTLAFDLQGILVKDGTGGFQQRKGLVDRTIAAYKGISAHSTYDTYNLTTEGEALCVFDNIAIRWPHNVTPVF